MSYGRLEKAEAESIFERFEAKNVVEIDASSLTKDERSLRKYFNEQFAVGISEKHDFPLGLKLYTDLLSLDVIDMRTASDDCFWRNLTCRVVPDYVCKRWPAKEKGGVSKWNADRFYKKPQRNWLKIIWWMYHLSWQGTEEKTKKAVRNLGSDAISQVVERTGQGYPVNLYREIIARIGEYPDQTTAEKALRRAMKLNTMRIQTTVPEFYDLGLKGYADSLLKNQ